jgi:Predicted membrane protein
VDVVECLTEGDCASVAVGYGLLPSFLSLDRVALATRTQAALLAAIASECRELGNPPRVLLYGESLGAKVQQRALPGGVADLERLGVDRALWVGTPGGKDYDDAHRLFDPVAITIDRPRTASAGDRRAPAGVVLGARWRSGGAFPVGSDYRRPSWLDQAHRVAGFRRTCVDLGSPGQCWWIRFRTSHAEIPQGADTASGAVPRFSAWMLARVTRCTRVTPWKSLDNWELCRSGSGKGLTVLRRLELKFQIADP